MNRGGDVFCLDATTPRAPRSHAPPLHLLTPPVARRRASRVEYIKSGVQSKLGLQGWEEKQRQMRKAAKEKRMQAVLESIGDNWGLESILTPEQMRALREKRRREELKRLAQEAKERKAR